MIYVLHLPLFPEGSPVNPDAVTDLLFDNQTSDDIAHIVLVAENEEEAIGWTTDFLKVNPQIPQDEVTLTSTDEDFQMSGLSCFRALYGLLTTSSYRNVEAFYLPQKRVKQQVVELPVTA